MKTCKYCGTAQSENNKFCENCGALMENETTTVETPLEQEEQVRQEQNIPMQDYQKEPKKSSDNSVKIIVIIIIILAALFIAKPFITNKQNNNSNNNANHQLSTEKNKENNKVAVTYNVGDAVTLVDDSKWHVISVSGEKVTLLLDELVVEHSGYSNVGGDEFHQKYENSYVKEYIEQTYLPSLKTSLENNGGDTTNLKARLITAQEFLDLTGHKLTDTKLQSEEGPSITKEQKKNQDWLSMTDSYWTMTNVKEIDPTNNYYGAYSVFVLLDAKLWSDGDANAQSWYINNTASGIRPVIETTIKNIK